MYGLCGGNAARASREYALRFPGRNNPSANTVQAVFNRLRETGLVSRRRHRERATTENVNTVRILDMVRDDPETSTRRVGLRLGISHQVVHRVLHSNGLYPYHVSKVQNLFPEDTAARIQFCQCWAEENPHGVHITNYQHEFSVHVWMGLLQNQLIGPVILPANLNATQYRNAARLCKMSAR
ncbi:hypothetical protein GE061_000585 [Apolygus lucorum]|uniref:Uncharacterized protein n=1 Tax=Apolygus lucorum TaxID=248454 RepID=A0A6A4KJT3_APOLU|nr:hypothetical protein GE061_000585 [Apolygus lucorum]